MLLGELEEEGHVSLSWIFLTTTHAKVEIREFIRTNFFSTIKYFVPNFFKDKYFFCLHN